MTIRIPAPEEVPPPGGARWEVGAPRGTRWYWSPRMAVQVNRWKVVEARATPGAYWLRYPAVFVAISWGWWLFYVVRFVERRPET